MLGSKLSAVHNSVSHSQSRRHGGQAIVSLVAGAFFMEMLDGTIIATALPQMARSFGVSSVEANIGMTAYLLALAVFIPMSGWAADRFGGRTVFGGAIALFTVMSVFCGFSNSLWGFALARVLQGFAGAMMVPVGRLIVLRSVTKEELMQAVWVTTWPGLIAPIIGPPIGGLITTYSSWRWIFFLNVPLGLIGFLLTIWLVPNVREGKPRGFDWLGFFYTSAACTALVYGLELVAQPDIAWTRLAWLTAGTLIFGFLAIRHAYRAANPLVRLSALRIKTFAITIWGGSLFRITISVVPFLLPLMFQLGFGLNAFQSGLLVLSVFAGNLCMKTRTSFVLRSFGFRNVLLANGVLNVVSLWACCALTRETPTWIIVIVLFIGGLSRSLQFTGLNTLGFADVPPGEMSSATTFSTLIQQLTAGMGVAVGAVALRLAVMVTGHAVEKPGVRDFHLAFGLTGLIAVFALFDYWRLTPDAGAIVSGHEIRPKPREAAESS
jgi:EmrB/QacA subfamily drug resistance transporter